MLKLIFSPKSQFLRKTQKNHPEAIAQSSFDGQANSNISQKARMAKGVAHATF